MPYCSHPSFDRSCSRLCRFGITVFLCKIFLQKIKIFPAQFHLVVLTKIHLRYFVNRVLHHPDPFFHIIRVFHIVCLSLGHLRDTRPVRGNHYRTEKHCLDRRHAKALKHTGKEERPAVAVQRVSLGILHESRERYLPLQTSVTYLSFQPVPALPVDPGNQQSARQIRPRAFNPLHNRNQRIQILMRNQLRNRIVKSLLLHMILFRKAVKSDRLLFYHRNWIVDRCNFIPPHMIFFPDVIPHPVGNRHKMSGQMRVQPPAQSGVRNFVERMIFWVMRRLQIMNHIDVSNAAVKQRTTIYRHKAFADFPFSQESVLAEKVPQNPPRNIGGYHFRLQKFHPLILCIMAERLLIVLRYEQKKAEWFLKS